MGYRNYSRQQLCDVVFQAVMQAETPLTRLEICHAIKRKKSPHILDMIQHLVDTGWLIKFDDVDPLDRPAFRYRVAQLGQPDCHEFSDTKLEEKQPTP